MHRIPRVAALIVTTLAAGSLTIPSADAYSRVVKPQPVTIASGAGHTLLVAADATLYATGSDTAGQLGNGAAGSRTDLTKSSLPSGVKAAAVAAGETTSFVVSTKGQVYAAGTDASGALGLGPDVTSAQSFTAMLLPSGVKATAVAAGRHHTLVLDDLGRVWATGDNDRSQLGLDDTTDRHTPTLAALPAGITAKAISAGPTASLVLGSNNKVYGAGDNSSSQLSRSGATVPTFRPFLDWPAGVRATAVAMSDQAAFYLTVDGEVYGVGENGDHELGDGTSTSRTRPVRVEGLPARVEALSAGDHHVLIVSAGGAIYAAGPDVDGEAAGSVSSNPTRARLLLEDDDATIPVGRALEVAAGPANSLVRDVDGVIWGSGSNADGQLGSTVAQPGTDRVTSFPSQVITPYDLPAIAGNTKKGKTLTAHSGQWAPTPTRYTYQWKRNGVAMAGQTKSTYRTWSKDVGTWISVTVTASHGSDYVAGTATSYDRKITR